jgi:hypothetical protein
MMEEVNEESEQAIHYHFHVFRPMLLNIDMPRDNDEVALPFTALH